MLSFTVTKVIDATTVCKHEGNTFDMQKRPANGLTFSLGGCITYCHDGKRYRSDETNAVILPENSAYSLKCERSGYFPLVNFHTAESLGDAPVIIPAAEKSAVINLYGELRRCMQTSGSGFKALELINGIFARLYKDDSGENDTVSEIKRYVDENLGNASLSNGEIAAAVGISEVYLRKLFTEKTGIPPHKYILEARISEAKRDLTETPLPVSEISSLTGFNSIYHFCRVFKAKTGVTPTEYRRNLML